MVGTMAFRVFVTDMKAAILDFAYGNFHIPNRSPSESRGKNAIPTAQPYSTSTLLKSILTGVTFCHPAMGKKRVPVTRMRLLAYLAAKSL